ncbi:mitochondrial RNA binding complex 1 subunit, putative [Leishmania panamensis]|uniref:Mitochondrial RNA binding complex 1 subunit, putative n=2 Tax=Leishmania guyanensis species complex TaxID=38579 RepID=A0A088RSR7_LEIPA|nr:mitochondrial RNA binding complex 1 subunit, putative [Leishmania panamensis]AIN99023.1 mitochondrial RNA binding complex 1 subunit, putative [Leishmania panamensis]
MSWYYRGGSSSSSRGRGPYRGGGEGNFRRGRGSYADAVSDGNMNSNEEQQRGARHQSRSSGDDDSERESGDFASNAQRHAGPPLPLEALGSFLRDVDGSNYSQLKQLTGRTYSLTQQMSPDPASVSIRFVRIQSDPFAPGSQVCVTVQTPFSAYALLHSADPTPPVVAAAPLSHRLSPEDVACRRVAAEDFILRCVKDGLAASRHTSGAVQTIHQSQHVLPRSTVQVVDANEAGGSDGISVGWIHVYFRVKLPGHGRRIDGRRIQQILFSEVLPVFQENVLRCDHRALWAHVTCVHDQEWLRSQLRERGLTAFIADGAVLPRAAGNSDKRLSGPNVVTFSSPDTLRHTFHLPYSGRSISGAGLPHGLTLIAGGGFHGKSTLLRALELGVYNHVPDDGRTFVVVDPTAVKIRAEDRRAVHGTDISPFITNLPYGDNTTAFITADASGSTSQAANIMEALELGSTALLLDEDTSATNFMFRDPLMEQLVPRTQEPITCFVHRICDLIHHHGISVIMVVGGSGQYFPMADVVLVLNAYKVTDATARAKVIAAQNIGGSGAGFVESTAPSATSAFCLPPRRSFLYADTFGQLGWQSQQQHHHHHGYGGSGRGIKISGSGIDHIRMADEDINVTLLEQLVEEGQLNAIAQCLAMLYDNGSASAAQWQREAAPRPKYPPSLLKPLCADATAATGASAPTLSDFARLVYNCEGRLRQARLEPQTSSCYLPAGFTALPRVFEIGAALNRLRTLVTSCK